MANIQFQCIKEADIATDAKVTTQGVVTFSERSIYLGLGNDKKVLYDGISPNNFLKSIEIDDKPQDTDGEDGELRIVKSEGIIYLKDNGTWIPLGKSSEITLEGNTSDIADILVNRDAAYYPTYNEKYVQLPISEEGLYIAADSTCSLSYQRGTLLRSANTPTETTIMFNPKWKIIIFKPVSEGFWYVNRVANNNPLSINSTYYVVGTGTSIRATTIKIENQQSNVISNQALTHVIPDGEYCILFNNSYCTLYRTYYQGNFAKKVDWIMKTDDASFNLTAGQATRQLGIRLDTNGTTFPRSQYPNNSMMINPIGIEDISGIIADIENPTQEELYTLIPSYTRLLEVLAPLNS